MSGINTILSKDIPSAGVELMVLQSALTHHSPTDIQLGWDLVTVNATAYDLLHFLSQEIHHLTSYTVDGGVVILKEPTIRIETLHHKIKVIRQKKFILTCNDPSL